MDLDLLANSLYDLQIQPSKNIIIKPKKEKRNCEAEISPVDFVQLQSMRSSALARKTNTTSKFSRDCKNLYEDLLVLNVKDLSPVKNSESKDFKSQISTTKIFENEQKVFFLFLKIFLNFKFYFTRIFTYKHYA